MAETDFTTLEDKRSDRSTMQVLYGLHTVAPFTLWSLSVIAPVSYTHLTLPTTSRG